MQVHERLFIDGDWIAPSSSATLDVINPFTEEVIARVPEGREADIDRAVAAARAAFDTGPWPRMTQHERADVMARLLAILQERAAEFATTITEEMGCPISFSNMGQVMAANMVLDYYVNLTRSYAFEDLRPGMLGPALVQREAVGVAGCIVPWNVPLFVTMLKIAPALAAGATVVLKPAPETPLDAFMLADALKAAGLPKGVVNVVPAGREVGEHLVRHPDVNKIAFTGSTPAGRKIASICGEQLKRVTLELGGKSAAIILDDADLGSTIGGLLPAAIMNNGQACVAQTRILASKKRYQEVADAFAEALKATPVGDPMDPMTMVGPLFAARQRERVEGYIKIGRDEGAKVACGGGRPAGQSKGFFVEPTLFVGVTNQMRIAQEEIFGPVVSVIAYDDVQDALRIANDSEYGLSGSVWCANPEEGLGIARQVRTGTYSVNGFAMEFGAPFGGYKSSGLGRELGPEGLAAYLESKTINLPFGFEPKLQA